MQAPQQPTRGQPQYRRGAARGGPPQPRGSPMGSNRGRGPQRGPMRGARPIGRSSAQNRPQEKPRGFQPYSQSDYKRLKAADEHALKHLGGLGADLDREDVVAARLKREKMMQYASSVRNRAPRGPQRPPPDEELRLQRRHRASKAKASRMAEYSRTIPRPVRRPSPPQLKKPQHDPQGLAVRDANLLAELSRHDADRQTVNSIANKYLVGTAADGGVPPRSIATAADAAPYDEMEDAYGLFKPGAASAPPGTCGYSPTSDRPMSYNTTSEAMTTAQTMLSTHVPAAQDTFSDDGYPGIFGDESAPDLVESTSSKVAPLTPQHEEDHFGIEPTVVDDFEADPLASSNVGLKSVRDRPPTGPQMDREEQEREISPPTLAARPPSVPRPQSTRSVASTRPGSVPRPPSGLRPASHRSVSSIHEYGTEHDFERPSSVHSRPPTHSEDRPGSGRPLSGALSARSNSRPVTTEAVDRPPNGGLYEDEPAMLEEEPEMTFDMGEEMDRPTAIVERPTSHVSAHSVHPSRPASGRPASRAMSLHDDIVGGVQDLEVEDVPAFEAPTAAQPSSELPVDRFDGSPEDDDALSARFAKFSDMDVFQSVAV